MANQRGLHIHIDGIVQGVGFRPFVFGLARRYSLTGWVRNSSAGVDIEINGPAADIERFLTAIAAEAPPLSQIDKISTTEISSIGYTDFEIIHSEIIADGFVPISPDVTICEDCLRELFDPADRRYLYPFINCTNCGPRFTIINNIPYDRPNTTMATFRMCQECAAEYTDPLNRRFHAQPIACPSCGPKVWLEYNENLTTESSNKSFLQSHDALLETRRLLSQGKIVAIKGLGGFHLACDANNPDAVSELRRRKLRRDKPFAVMLADLQTVQSHCYILPFERQLLISRQSPIVILRRLPGSSIALAVAPNQVTLGVMLPYTPLHHLIFSNNIDQLNTPSSIPTSEFRLSALVMTSGNLCDEPIAILNEEARSSLSTLADAFLMHDRPIHTRCDDSVVQVISADQDKHLGVSTGFEPSLYSLRRSRGYAPIPIHIPWEAPEILATGAELKNTFCLLRGPYAFLSHHIGDLENYETLRSFEDGINHFKQLFKIQPVALAYDLHPNILATRYALALAEGENLPALGVQHHHAHIAACMVENGLTGDQPAIGVSFDGSGYGDDGAIWGGEFLIADYSSYERHFHLAYTPLPGGDKAVREPWRMALSWLHHSGIDWDKSLPPVAHVSKDKFDSIDRLTAIKHQIQTGINAPHCSSMGRLFDAAASICGLRHVVSYEAQAAVEFEQWVEPCEMDFYPFEINFSGSVDPTPLWQALVDDVRAGVPIPIISARFHNGVAEMVLQVVMAMRRTSGISHVALSGGVWQNTTLLNLSLEKLRSHGFMVFVHHKVPANDGGLALGQAAIAARVFETSSYSLTAGVNQSLT